MPVNSKLLKSFNMINNNGSFLLLILNVQFYVSEKIRNLQIKYGRPSLVYFFLSNRQYNLCKKKNSF